MWSHRGGNRWRKGWSAKDAEKAVDKVAALKEADPAMTIGNLMRAALRSLAR